MFATFRATRLFRIIPVLLTPPPGTGPILALVFILGTLPLGGAAQEGGTDNAPRRIVSINLATDELLLDLVHPERITALSRLATDPEVSRLAHRAANFPVTDGSPEDLLRLQPDLVLASIYTRPRTRDILARANIPLVIVPPADDLPSARKALLLVAEAVHEEARGEELARRIDTVLQEIPVAATRPRTLVVGHGGSLYGEDTLWGHLLEVAGMENHATRWGVTSHGRLRLEDFLLDPPDLLIVLTYHPQNPSRGSLWPQHRALRGHSATVPTLEIPLAWTLNANHLTVETIHMLRAERTTRFSGTP